MNTRLTLKMLLVGLTLTLHSCAVPLPGTDGQVQVTLMPPLLAGVANVLPVNPGSVESAIIRYTNQEREKLGLSALQEHPTLKALARKHAEDMSARGYFSHQDPEGRGPTERLQQFFPGTLFAAGENILQYPRSMRAGDDAFAKAMVDGWMTSTGHRENLLRADYKWIGVGVAVGSQDLYGTQNFSF